MTHFDFGLIPSELHTRLYPSNMAAIRQEFMPPRQDLIFISGAGRRDTTIFALFFPVSTRINPHWSVADLGKCMPSCKTRAVTLT